MSDGNVINMYQTINDKNQKLINKKDELEFILNRYNHVISKIDPSQIPDKEDKILIQTLHDIFKNGECNINELIDTYLKNLINLKQ